MQADEELELCYVTSKVQAQREGEGSMTFRTEAKELAPASDRGDEAL